MELRHLRYFVAVADTMNFRRAAENLGMTQPPLSQQIQRLENELGFALFHRRGRSIALTDAGAVFLTEAQRILAQVEVAVHRAAQTARGEAGQLHVGFVGSMAYSLLPQVLSTFHQQFPHVAVNLRELTSNQQMQALTTATIDVGLGWFITDNIEAGLRVETIADERLCAVLPRDHRLSGVESLHTANLSDERFILFPRHLGVYLFDRVAAVCLAAGFTLHVEQEAIQMTTIVGLVAAGMGISILPASVMTLTHPGVVYRPLHPTESAHISLIYREEPPAPVLTNFIAALRTYASLRTQSPST